MSVEFFPTIDIETLCVCQRQTDTNIIEGQKMHENTDFVMSEMFVEHIDRVSLHAIYALAFIVIIHKICINMQRNTGIKIKIKAK